MSRTYDELTAENIRLREALKKLSAVTFSGHDCSSCKLPTSETEFVVNHGLCNRCVNSSLDDDRWKELRSRLEDMEKGLEEVNHAHGEGYVDALRTCLSIIDDVKGGE